MFLAWLFIHKSVQQDVIQSTLEVNMAMANGKWTMNDVFSMENWDISLPCSFIQFLMCP